MSYWDGHLDHDVLVCLINGRFGGESCDAFTAFMVGQVINPVSDYREVRVPPISKALQRLKRKKIVKNSGIWWSLAEKSDHAI